MAFDPNVGGNTVVDKQTLYKMKYEIQKQFLNIYKIFYVGGIAVESKQTLKKSNTKIVFKNLYNFPKNMSPNLANYKLQFLILKFN